MQLNFDLKREEEPLVHNPNARTLDEILRNAKLTFEFINKLGELAPENNDDNLQTLFNAQVMMAESCLDRYMHDLCMVAIVAMYTGRWRRSGKYQREVFIQLNQVWKQKSISAEDWLWNNIEAILIDNKILPRLSFMSFSALENVLELCNINYPSRQNLWDNIKFNPPDNAQEFLSKVYKLRNIIVHQGGSEFYGKELPEKLTSDTTKCYIENIKKIIEAIHHKVIECNPSKNKRNAY